MLCTDNHCDAASNSVCLPAKVGCSVQSNASCAVSRACLGAGADTLQAGNCVLVDLEMVIVQCVAPVFLLFVVKIFGPPRRQALPPSGAFEGALHCPVHLESWCCG